MVYDALKQTHLKRKDVNIYVIGDRLADVQTAINAKGTGILIPFKNEGEELQKLNKFNKSRESRGKSSIKSKIHVATDFLDAANYILEKETNRRTIKAKKSTLYEKASKLIESRIKSIKKAKIADLDQKKTKTASFSKKQPILTARSQKQAKMTFKSKKELKITYLSQKKLISPDLGQTKVILGFVGGNTVIPLLKRLKKAKIAWKDVHIFMLDERLLPITNKNSNFKQAYDILLKPLIKEGKLPEENIHPFVPDKTKANYGINSYSNKLKKLGGKIDIAILSSGEDGHIASLFPNKVNQAKGKYFSIVKDSPKPPKLRMTATKSLITNSDTAILLTIGKNKNKARQDLENKDLDSNQSPQKLILSINNSYVLTDQ